MAEHFLQMNLVKKQCTS